MHDGSFVVQMISGVPVVSAPAQIDVINELDLRSALLAAAVAGGSGTVVADLTRTSLCDSCGVRTLLAAQERAQAEGGELLLVISSAVVLRTFSVAAADRVIPFFTSLDDALAHTSRPAGPTSGEEPLNEFRTGFPRLTG
jgi:anti-sigma B factor antagonist